MDAFIHGYSNFTATVPVTEERIVAPMMEVPATFSPSVYDDSVRRSSTAVTTNSAETLPSTPVYTAGSDEIYDAGDVTARLETMRAKRLADAQRVAQIEAEKQASLNNPIIVIPPSYVAPPLIVGGGSGGGSGGGGDISGMPPLSSSAVVAKESFLKKNFIPLLLIASAIYVFIKKPIK